MWRMSYKIRIATIVSIRLYKSTIYGGWVKWHVSTGRLNTWDASGRATSCLYMLTLPFICTCVCCGTKHLIMRIAYRNNSRPHLCSRRSN